MFVLTDRRRRTIGTGMAAGIVALLLASASPAGAAPSSPAAMAAMAATSAPQRVASGVCPGDHPVPKTIYQQDPDEIVVMTEPLCITYGDYWSFRFRSAWRQYYPPRVVEIPGPLSAVAATAVTFTSEKEPDDIELFYGYLFPPSSLGPIDAGSYELVMTFRGTAYSVEEVVQTTKIPAKLTIAPASLRVDSRVQQDANNPAVTIVSASLTGEFIDNWGWTSTTTDLQPATPRIPGGTWRVTVTDDAGAAVVDETFERPAGAVPSVTLALTDLPSDAALSAEVTFTPEASSAGNFTLTEAEPFTFTTTAVARPILAVDDDTLDDPIVVSDPGPTLPVGVLGLAALLAVGLIVVIVVQLLRLFRGRPAGGAPGDADPAASESVKGDPAGDDPVAPIEAPREISESAP